MNQHWRVFLLSLLFVIIINLAASTALAQGSAPPARKESEAAIRTAIYETALASETGDIKLYRRHIAMRTLELNKLIFQGLREVPEYNEALVENGLDTADKFMDKMFVQGASQYASLTKVQIEERARAQSAGPITFLSDREAILQVGDSSLRAVWEDNQWKVDETESGKNFFLQNFQFKPETKAKIEKL